MDEKLKNQLLISVIPAGVVFMAYMLIFNWAGQMMGYVIAFILAAIVGGGVFGVLYMMQKE
jgi:hypothetical protein